MDQKPVRQWQEIADELTSEFDPNRVIKLSTELNEALTEELRILETQRKEKPRGLANL